MTAAAALVNLVLGTAYLGYGVMTAMELKRDWRSFGFSPFGAAWIFMAFTCGPHHLFHGIHLAAEGRPGGAADVAAVAIGLPVGVLWLYLRVEAFAGGRGDRFLPGTPAWLRVAAGAGAVYVTAVVTAVAVQVGSGGHRISVVPANLVLIALYLAIAAVVIKTQLANRPAIGGWSVSGLCLSAIFPTCAVMHAVWASHAVAGLYRFDVHGFVIDWLSVPAAGYFLWVVRRLYRDALADWNEGPDQVTGVGPVTVR